MAQFSYSVKFLCGVQKEAHCSPVRPGTYATEVNIHNYHPQIEAAIEKRIFLLVKQGEVAGREPKFVKAQPFDRIVLPPESATMDDCCRLEEKLQLQAGGPINICILELISNVELAVTAVYTSNDPKSNGLSVQVQNIAGRPLP